MAETFNGAGVGSVLALRQRPTAVPVSDTEVGVLGCIVKLDGTPSLDPDNLGLRYEWSFEVVPIGSTVIEEGFRTLDEGIVSFSPDRVGEYRVRLKVSNPHFESSATLLVSIRAILVPDARGLVPDGKFIWSYLRDVWQQVENREVFETLWSALIQIVGGETLKAYQVDFNKSIRDIQERMQRRWLSYEPKVAIDDPDTMVVFGFEGAGTDGSTAFLGQEGKAVIVSSGEMVVVEGAVAANAPSPVTITYSRSAANIGQFGLSGPNASQTGYRLSTPIPEPTADIVMSNVQLTFPFQSRTWSLGVAPAKDYALRMSMYSPPIDELIPLFAVGHGGASDLRAGDFIHIRAGINQGLYRINRVTGSFVEVDRTPPSSSTALMDVVVYRPVGFRLLPFPIEVTNTLSIPVNEGSASLANLTPGRVVLIGGRAFTVFRSYLDNRQAVPLYVITTDTAEVVPGLVGQNWRVPNTLYSPSTDFKALGIATGDTIAFEVSDGTNTTEVRGQVFGVTTHRIGFVLTTDPIAPGELYVATEEAFAKSATELNIPSVVTMPNGDVRLTNQANTLWRYLNSIEFRSKYWGKELKLSSGIATPVGTYTAKVKWIIRNSNIPVDAMVASIPALQEWISTPEVMEKDGKLYQVRGQKEFEIDHPPIVLLEGSDYTVDDHVVYEDLAIFKTGTNIFEVSGASFSAKRVAPGDTVTIQSPPTIAATYTVVEVLSQDTLLLSSPIPLLDAIVVSARVLVERRTAGTFLRFVPGSFTPSAPAPDRLWAEVTYFDNSEAIESNFGIMVGLTRSDFEKISPHASYRQAVAGLMFAYTRGSAIEKVRLGAQILLGLPFSEHRGIIRSIDEDYRLDVSGQPIYGRLLVEDVEQDGTAMGVQRVYTYPIDPEGSQLSGIETNPATGKTYVVGDYVEIFAPLSKGVQIADYVSEPLPPWATVQELLQQFHSFKMRANANIFDLKEIALVSQFLKRITPSYVSFVLSDLIEVGDDPLVQDFLTLLLRVSDGGGGGGLIDNIGLGINTGLSWDQVTYGGISLIRWDEGIYRMRQSGASAETTGVAGEVIVERAVGATVARPGDYLYLLTGPNQGRYDIQQVAGTTITTDGDPFVSAQGQAWYIARLVRHEFRNGTVAGSSNAPGTVVTSWLDLEPGVIDDGIMFGDWLLLADDNGDVRRHIVVGVEDSRVRVFPEAPFDVLTEGGEPVTTESGEIVQSVPPNVAYQIHRQCFIESPSLNSYLLESDGTSYISLDPWAIALLDAGDSLLATALDAELFVANPGSLDFTPVLPAGQYSVRLRKQGAYPAPLGFDLLDRWSVNDVLALRTKSQGTVTMAIGQSTLTLPGGTNVLPGDVLQFLEPSGRPSLGYQDLSNDYDVAEELPVVAVHTSNSTVDLAYPMADAGPSEWAIARRR